MKELVYLELCSLIIKYMECSEDVFADKNTCRQVNKTFKLINKTVKKINSIFAIIASQENINVKFLIDRLLNETDIRLNYYGALFAINCKYKNACAVQILQKVSASKIYVHTAETVKFLLDSYMGKYGGWKRDERYPDLSEYEDKMIDE